MIGHELSHVRNLDIRFALLVGVLVGTIVLMADWALRYTFWFGGGRRSRDGKGGGAQAILLVVGLVLAILAPMFAPSRPARRQPPARVPRRRHERRADPQPRRSRAARSRRSPATRRCSRSRTARPTTSTS